MICSEESQITPRKTICLNMIVKNEREIIHKSLASVKGIVDYWVIVDTGSTDGTQSVIKELMKDIPGELYEHPWVDFAHNRNQALTLAKDKADYILFMDADEELIFSDAFVMPELTQDSYSFIIRQAGKGVDYQRTLMINNHLSWNWEGVVHESITAKEPRSKELMQNVIALSHTYGDRSKDPQKYLKDAQILERALEKDPTNARYAYYLAQSYLNVPDYPKALKYYELRASMGGWDQEVFFSKYCVGMLQADLDYPTDVIIKSLTDAYILRPTRAEPLYRLAQHYLKKKNHFLAYLVCKHALMLPIPNDSVFVEKWIYEWGLHLAAAEASYFLGGYVESIEIIQKLLQVPDLPEPTKVELRKNRQIMENILQI